MTLLELNRSEEENARSALLACCGSRRWAGQMIEKRPFDTLEMIHEAADNIWWSLSESDWLEAFACHPKIGERKSVSAWSAEEQRGMAAATSNIVANVATLNDEYEKRFGYIFIVCASGKSAREIQDFLQQRLRNEPQKELRLAAAEQLNITHLRLDKLIKV